MPLTTNVGSVCPGMALLCNPEGRVEVSNMKIVLHREILLTIFDNGLCPVMSVSDFTNIHTVK
jgi:hypothetical protein